MLVLSRDEWKPNIVLPWLELIFSDALRRRSLRRLSADLLAVARQIVETCVYVIQFDGAHAKPLVSPMFSFLRIAWKSACSLPESPDAVGGGTPFIFAVSSSRRRRGSRLSRRLCLFSAHRGSVFLGLFFLEQRQ